VSLRGFAEGWSKQQGAGKRKGRMENEQAAEARWTEKRERKGRKRKTKQERNRLSDPGEGKESLKD
jgi:hypothetical protein